MRTCVADLEANGLLDSVTKIHCGVFKDIKSGEIFKFHPGSHVDYVKSMCDFMDGCKILIFHNGIGYDMPLLKKLANYTFKGTLVDTLIISRLHSPNRRRAWGYEGKGGPHSIEHWGYLVGRWKPEHNDWENYSPEMLHRCTEDVEILELVYNYLKDERTEIGGSAWNKALPLTHRLFTILQKQEEYGWLVDQEHLHKSIHMLTHWMDRTVRVLDSRLPLALVHEEGNEKTIPGQRKYVKKPFLKSGKPNRFVAERWGDDVELVSGPHTRIHFRTVSLDKDKEVKAFLLDLGWIPKEWNTNDDGETTSPKLSKDDPFEGVQGSMGRLIARRVQCKQRRAILQGWVNRLRPDGRLPSRVTGLAATGRAKHSEIVNVPNCEAFFGKWMRKVFTCPPDRVLVSTDASSCQDRMLAQRAKVDEFTDMLLNGCKEKGTDGHSVARRAVNRAHTALGLTLISRGKAKNYNFAFKFGASDNKLGSMSVSDANAGALIRAELRKEFHAQAAVVDSLTEIWKGNAQVTKNKWGKDQYKNGWIPGLDGRPIFIESEHAILVYMLQSDEAIMMTTAYVMMYDRILEAGYEWGRDWAFVCFYHDEVTVECRPEIAEEIGRIQEDCIRDAGLQLGLTYCPQAGEMAIGRNWKEIH